MTRKKYNIHPCDSKRCWVGDSHKVCYATEEEARMVAGALEYQHAELKLTVYQCPQCGDWHLAKRS